MTELAPNPYADPTDERGKRSTRVLSGPQDELTTFFSNFVLRAASDERSPRLDAISDDEGPAGLFGKSIELAMNSINAHNLSVRYITDIQPRNLNAVQKLLASGAEVRHIGGTKENIALSAAREYLSVNARLQDGAPSTLIWSNNPDLVGQMASVFAELWNCAVPASQRIDEIVEGRSPEVVEFIMKRELVLERVIQILRNSRKELLGIGNSDAPTLIMKNEHYRRAVEECSRRHLDARYITNVTKENIEHCKRLVNEFHVDVRYIENLKPNLIMSDGEYIADLSPPHPERPSTKALYSNSKELLAQQKQLFDSLWSIAVPATQRFEEIELGLDLGTTRFTYDQKEVMNAFDEMVSSVEGEALVIMPAESAVRRNVRVLQKLARKARESGVVARILVPSNFLEQSPSIGALVEELELQGLTFKVAERISSNFAYGIYDGKNMISAHFIEPAHVRESARREGSVLYSTITSNRETIAAVASVFEALWHESELKEMEKRARRQAELLQDIMAHDVRNYNQVARLGAEILQEELGENKVVNAMSENILAAIDGSSSLIDRARRLGKVLTERNVKLYSVELVRALSESFELARRSVRDKEKVVNRMSIAPTLRGEINVTADDLIDEIFVNIYSNCIKYTDSRIVEIETLVDELPAMREGKSVDYVRVSIADHGRGIPDDQKNLVFSRYLDSAKGSGLGMSIIYTLAVERYRGRVVLRDRAEGDHSKGTVIEVWLPKLEQ